MNTFEADLIAIEELRARGETDTDIGFLLGFIDRLWNEYSRTLETADSLRERVDFAIDELADKFITEAAAEFVRVAVLAVLRGQLSPAGKPVQMLAISEEKKQAIRDAIRRMPDHCLCWDSWRTNCQGLRDGTCRVRQQEEARR